MDDPNRPPAAPVAGPLGTAPAASHAPQAAPQAAGPMSVNTAVGYAAGAYFMWGLFPAFFKLLDHVPAPEILVHRMFWSLPAAALLVALTGRMKQVRAVLTDRRAVSMLAATAMLLALNWGVYVWAVNNGRILESSLGYYINPLVSVLIGVVLLGERLTRPQMIAVGLAALGVINQTIAVGALPWVSLLLAGTFAAYGYLRKTVNADSRTGLAVETGIMAPFALLAVIWLEQQGRGAFVSGGIDTTLLLIATGPVTAAPLLLFAVGARRLRLSTMGLLQYIGPTIQFLIGLGYGERFTPAHAVTFGLIWLALIIFTVDNILRDRAATKAARSG